MNKIFTNFDDIIASGIKYNILYPDVPWIYEDKALAGKVLSKIRHRSQILFLVKWGLMKNDSQKNLGFWGINLG